MSVCPIGFLIQAEARVEALQKELRETKLRCSEMTARVDELTTQHKVDKLAIANLEVMFFSSSL